MVSVKNVCFKANGSSLLQQASLSGQRREVTNPNQNIDRTNEQSLDLKTANTLTYVSTGVALAAIGVSTVAVVKTGQLKKALTILSNSVNSLPKSSDLENLSKKAIEEAKAHTDGVQKVVEEKITALGKWQDGHIGDLRKDVNDLSGRFISKSGNVDLDKNLYHIDGFRLLQNLENDGSQIKLPEEAIKKIQTVADEVIHNHQNKKQPPALSKSSTIWSVSAEAVPEKEGGLGEIPTQIAANLKNELGIKDNFLVIPLYEIPHKSSIVEKEIALDKDDICKRLTQYWYTYGDDKAVPQQVSKLVEFDVQVFRNGRSETQKVEVFKSIDKSQKQDAVNKIYIRNKDYFGTSSMYKTSQMSDEPERFAFFSRAVYDFMKLLGDRKSHTAYKVFDNSEFEKLKVPDAAILNDWHAASLAGLLKLKSVAEGAVGELDKDLASKFGNMNLVNITHNADYQGVAYSNRSEILNTLFGKYTADIYQNAKTGFEINNLDKILTCGEGHAVSLSNIGAALSTRIVPVSPTYATEIANQVERSRAMQHVYDVRLKQGTMGGILNGWDRSLNALPGKRAFIEQNLNSDIIKTLTDTLKDSKDLVYRQNPMTLQDVKISDFLAQLKNTRAFSVDDIDAELKAMKESENPIVVGLSKTIEDLNLPSLRKLHVYTHKNTIEEIMEARKANKANMFEYLNAVIAHDKDPKSVNKLTKLTALENTDISDITPEELQDVPFYTMGARFVSQKGIDILADSIKKLYSEWPTIHPGKKKPVFVIGGEDWEGGSIRKNILDLKNELGAEGNHIVYMDGFIPNPLFQAGCDFALSPSWFEPCGSQAEALAKATPMVLTKTGGQIDTIKDNITGYLTKSTSLELQAKVKQAASLNNVFDPKFNQEMRKLISGEYVEALKKSIDDFTKKDPYQKMVRSSIDEDFSWVIKDEDNNIVGGSLAEYLKVFNFNFSEFKNLKLPNTPEKAEGAVAKAVEEVVS